MNYFQFLWKILHLIHEIIKLVIIEKVYFIISHDTFLNKLTKKNKATGDYGPSDYILGNATDKELKELPHPDCFRSKKSVLIIDEIQKMTSEIKTEGSGKVTGGKNYSKLFNTLQIYARDPLTGEPRMKVVILTATPILY